MCDLFMGDLTGHHREWLATNRHGVAALDFATVSGSDQLVIGVNYHARGETLDVLMTEVIDLLRLTVVTPLGN